VYDIRVLGTLTTLWIDRKKKKKNLGKKKKNKKKNIVLKSSVKNLV
jgi:hypothetical protein